MFSRARSLFTLSIYATAYAADMTEPSQKDTPMTGLRRVACTEASTARVSLTSAAVCIAILAWAIINAYLSRL